MRLLTLRICLDSLGKLSEEPTYIYGKVEPKPPVYVDADGYPIDYNDY